MTLRPDLPPTDAELIRQVLAGAEVGFRELYRRHTPRLHGVVLRLLAGDVSSAEDVTQETWIRAVTGLGQFRSESAFSTWLTAIGIRVGWEALRRQKPHEIFDDDSDAGFDPPDTAAQLDLAAALTRLPAAQRAVVLLHDVEGFGHDEIAAWLGVATSTSRSYLFRGRRALRTMLCAYQEVPDER